MKVGIKLGKVKKFGIGWCIHHRMAADNAEGGSGQTPPPGGKRVKAFGIMNLQYEIRIYHKIYK